MGGGGGGGGLYAAKDYPWQYLFASMGSATINYPLWRASAISQAGYATTAISTSNTIMTLFHRSIPNPLLPYVYGFLPPYKGMIATVLGMTWARAAIFWGSDAGRDFLRKYHVYSSVSTILPPLVVSTAVQIINQPLVRATITIQNPASEIPNVRSAVQHIYHTHGGWPALWHGVSAGIAKTVPKYCTAVIVKDVVEHVLEKNKDCYFCHDPLVRSAIKSVCAGVAGAALTNPLDVIRNEMFKTNFSFLDTVRHLQSSSSSALQWMCRGMEKNMIAVAVPVACTIFFTDALIQYTRSNSSSKSNHDDYYSDNKGGGGTASTN
jgi:hypothetical protein